MPNTRTESGSNLGLMLGTDDVVFTHANTSEFEFVNILNILVATVISGNIFVAALTPLLLKNILSILVQFISSSGFLKFSSFLSAST